MEADDESTAPRSNSRLSRSTFIVPVIVTVQKSWPRPPDYPIRRRHLVTYYARQRSENVFPPNKF